MAQLLKFKKIIFVLMKFSTKMLINKLFFKQLAWKCVKGYFKDLMEPFLLMVKLVQEKHIQSLDNNRKIIMD